MPRSSSTTSRRRLAAAARQPDRGGRPVRGRASAVPGRARRPRPPAHARPGAPRRAVRGRLGAARPPAPPADRHPPGGDAADGRPHRAPDPDRDPRARLLASPLFDQWRRPARRLPAHLGVRDAVLRHRRGLRGDRRRERLERGPVPDLVPDRRGLDGRLAGARDRVPAGPDPVRLQLRAVPVPGGRSSRSWSGTSPSTPAPGPCPLLYLIAAAILALAVAVETYFQNDRWPMLAAGAVVGATIALDRPDGGGDAAGPGLRARSGDRASRSRRSSRRSSGCSRRS